jgi:hypothetical protein
MKKLQNCEVENCIPTPSSCVTWNGGDIKYLGICDGDSLNDIIVEIVSKLQEIAGEDLSQFDIDSLTEICNQKAPNEVTLLSILNLIKANQICLKDFIDTLSEQLASLLSNTGVTINLKCYADFDNLGNALSITREQLDQLVIDNLCNHKDRIETLEGKVVSLQSQIDNIDINPAVDEPEFATCIDAAIKPTSGQTVSIANALCDLRDATGDETDITSALGSTPADMNAEFGLLPGWIVNPQNWAENYNNLLIAFGNVWARVKTIESTCCALTCDDIKLGFSAVYNEDGDGIIISFTYGAGTVIPAGFTDGGSYGTITDIDGNVVDFNITIGNNSQEEVIIAGLNTTGELTISITAILGTGSLTCQKCLSRKVNKASCNYCEICATGAEGSSVVIVYESSKTSSIIENAAALSTTTTTSSTTTTTTAAP